jgi:predicted O-methyltransferase YrrM
MIDHFTFDSEDVVESFKLALAQGQEFIKANPESNYQILFDYNQKQVQLDYEVYSHRRHFYSLFGPGNVPGMTSEGDILAIAELAKQLPDSGIFVEMGPLFGKSTVEWARNLKELDKDYKIIAIDSFNTRIDIIHDLLTEAEFDIPPGDNQVEVFRHYTREYPNVHPLEVLWTTNSVFDVKVNGVFEDLTSTSKADPALLQYWWDRILPGGILCGKNYSTPEVKFAVDQFALLKDREIQTFKDSSIWRIIKD